MITMKDLYKYGLKSEQQDTNLQRMTVTVDADDVAQMRKLHPGFNVSLFLRQCIVHALEEEEGLR